MQITEFRLIVSTFADPGTEILFDKEEIVVSVNGDLIEAKISTQAGDVFVDEENRKVPASTWILTRLARLPLLADRLSSGIIPTEHFISPSASLSLTLAKNSNEEPVPENNAIELTRKTLDDNSPLESRVLYLTSDAGEGKTSCINQLALTQAKLYSENKSDWLLVPIPLGGRHFLRFDDITIGALQNRYRFPFLYYSSFLALVKMGVIVPAFDGFEEMFVENSSGEALSAMGILVGSLESQGTILIAARKAYFEFENLKTQERLFDTIRNFAVSFGKIELERWSKPQFIEYCSKRDVENPAELYRRVSARLTPDHALLTRAVLVKRLVDVAQDSPTLDSLLEQLQKSGTDFFSVFVHKLVEREATEKWIDRSGEKDIGAPLLTVNEHCELLSHVALAMWESRTDFLKRDILEFVADYYCEITKKDSFQSQQIKGRIRGHAMLVPSSNNDQAIEFDHDEFRLFFLGEGIASQLVSMDNRAKTEVQGAFRRGVLPRQAQHAFIRAITRKSSIIPIKVILFLLDIGEMDGQASYTQENVTDIIIRLLSNLDGEGLELHDLVFSANSLRERKFRNVSFRNCFFAPTSLELSEFRNCSFLNCNFSQLRIYNSTKFDKVFLNDSTVEALVLSDENRESWEPLEIRQQLEQFNISFNGTETKKIGTVVVRETDPELRDLDKIVRYFMRSTHISESVILIKLGTRGRSFIDETLPKLIKSNIMKEIENRGGVNQKRFGLSISLKELNSVIAKSNGSFNLLLSLCDD